ncbi:putative RING-H2 finger protein ATL71 [Andrographis paniculata]|uniref:putative RING-H2 finger protein ATL71 n=1 Tax=Andrographis paniculata TaxID=175694 RepID=UPI0021E88AE3|nr:putative RING-H2 finger protein ATL71 [Andrographis paniculata]
MSAPAAAPAGAALGSEGVGGFGYAIGVSAGIIVLITALTLVSYCWTRNTAAAPILPRTNSPAPAPPLNRFPKLLYSEAKASYKDSTATCCSICLADYKNSDMLRALPDCRHLFHLNCVDPWLRLHPTCPVCRTSSPLADPRRPATMPAAAGFMI